MSERKQTIEYWREKARVAEAEVERLREWHAGGFTLNYNRQTELVAEVERLREEVQQWEESDTPRLHRVEEAAKAALDSYYIDYKSETDSTAHDALRAALEEE